MNRSNKPIGHPYEGELADLVGELLITKVFS